MSLVWILTVNLPQASQQNIATVQLSSILLHILYYLPLLTWFQGNIQDATRLEKYKKTGNIKVNYLPFIVNYYPKMINFSESFPFKLLLLFISISLELNTCYMHGLCQVHYMFYVIWCMHMKERFYNLVDKTKLECEFRLIHEPINNLCYVH